MTEMQNDNSRKFAIAAAKSAVDRHSENVVVMDLKGKSPAADYFIIATGTSNRQMRTVADEICELARKMKIKRFGRAGYEHGRWVLVDFVSVVVHIFDAEYRDYYNLEMLWGDAEKINIESTDSKLT